MKTVTRLAGVLALVALTGAPQLHGQALVDFTGGTLFPSFQGDGDTIGWSFTTDQRFVLTHLGYWDGDFATQALTLSHPVGLWTSGGTPLADATVLPASPLTGNWRYVEAPAVVLPVATYHLGAFVSATNPPSDGYSTGATGWTMAPGFTMGETLRDPDGAQTGLVFPSVATAAGGRFGPNLRVATPAPAIDHSLTASLDGRTYACGALTAVAVPAGTDVFPCYTVHNTGNAPLSRHSVVDSNAGPLLNDFPYTLIPGAGAFLNAVAHAPAGGLWSSTWTAFNPGPFETAIDADALAVTLLPPFLTCNGRTATFSSGFPSGLSSFDAVAWPNSGDSSNDFWDLAACAEAQNWTGARGDVACASSDLASPGEYDTQLRTHAFSLSGQSSARVEFTLNYQQMSDTLALEGSTDYGVNWQLIEDFAASAGTFRAVGGVRRVVSIPAYVGAPAVRLRWRYANANVAASDLYVQIDNIAVTCGGGIFFDGFESVDTHAWTSATQ
jgi:hypothetical protein